MISDQKLSRFSLTSPTNVHLAWLLWAVLFVTVATMIIAGNRRTVTNAYAAGAQKWLEGAALYDGSGAGFIYFPQSAIAFIPFYQLPHEVSEISWRLLALGIFLVGFWRLALLSEQEHRVSLFPLMTLLCLPLTFSSLRAGQATLPLAGLMMMSVVDQCNRRWWRATLWLSIGLVVKPLMVVCILLAFALYPAMRLRLAVGLVVVFSFPFVCQRPSYVLSTYVDCWSMLIDADHLGVVNYWAQLFGMLRVFGLEVPHAVQTLTRLATAVATLCLCLLSLKRHTRVQAHVLQFALAAVYLMLMNPRTENNTYSLLGPAIAIICAQAYLGNKQLIRASVLLASAILILGSYEFGKFFVPAPQAVFLAPLGCLVFLAVLVNEFLSGRFLVEKPELDQETAPSATERVRAA